MGIETGAVVLKAHKPQLTARELEVLEWVAKGKTASETGSILSISVDTVNFHIKNCLRKLQVSNKACAMVSAVRLGLLNIENLLPIKAGSQCGPDYLDTTNQMACARPAKANECYRRADENIETSMRA